MAKRRRLTLNRSDDPAGVSKTGGPETAGAPEAKGAFPAPPPTLSPGPPPGLQPSRLRPAQLRAPIAEIAGDAASRAAFDSVAGELADARAGGRLVLALPLDAIDEGYLVRDRIAADPVEMTALVDSLRERGQQTPIDVVDLGGGRYGLITGWRRLQALRRLSAESGDAGESGETPAEPVTVLALLRRPADAADAYRAMVEENEIRAGLSYYERARIAAQATAQGAYPSTEDAIRSLYATASRPRRSKIRSFLAVHDALDTALRCPEAIPERLGLDLARTIGARDDFAPKLTAALQEAAPLTPQAERAVLVGALAATRATRRAAGQDADPVMAPVAGVSHAKRSAAAVRLSVARERVQLSGAGVDAAFVEDLRRWLSARAQASE